MCSGVPLSSRDRRCGSGEREERRVGREERKRAGERYLTTRESYLIVTLQGNINNDDSLFLDAVFETILQDIQKSVQRGREERREKREREMLQHRELKVRLPFLV